MSFDARPHPGPLPEGEGGSRWENAMSEHVELTRRYFLGLGVAGAALAALEQQAAGQTKALPAELNDPVSKLTYLTPPDTFGTVERGNPLPYTLPIEKRREVGLE